VQGGVVELDGETPLQLGVTKWRTLVTYVPQTRVHPKGTPSEFYFTVQVKPGPAPRTSARLGPFGYANVSLTAAKPELARTSKDHTMMVATRSCNPSPSGPVLIKVSLPKTLRHRPCLGCRAAIQGAEGAPARRPAGHHPRAGPRSAGRPQPALDGALGALPASRCRPGSVTTRSAKHRNSCGITHHADVDTAHRS